MLTVRVTVLGLLPVALCVVLLTLFGNPQPWQPYSIIASPPLIAQGGDGEQRPPTTWAMRPEGSTMPAREYPASRSRDDHPFAVVGRRAVASMVCDDVMSRSPGVRSTAGRFLDSFNTGNEELSAHIVSKEDSARMCTARVPTDAYQQLPDGPSALMLMKALFPPSGDGTAGGWNWSSPIHHSELAYHQKNGDSNAATAVTRFDANPRSRFCYYVLRNACVEHGRLVFFRDPTHANQSSGVDAQLKGKALRLCNELRRKFHLHYTVRDASFPGGGQPAAGRVHRAVAAHVPACWQYYGYHLFQCLASMFTMQLQHGLQDVDVWLYNHAASLPEASRAHFSHQLHLGSSQDFTDGGANRYWGLWEQNTQDPGRVRVLSGAAPTRPVMSTCYHTMLIGQVVHHELTTPQRRVHAMWLRNVLRRQFRRELQRPVSLAAATTDALWLDAAPLLNEDVGRSAHDNTTLRVTVADRTHGKRQGSRSIIDVGRLMAAIADHLMADQQHPKEWQPRPLPEQDGRTSGRGAHKEAEGRATLGCVRGLPSQFILDHVTRTLRGADSAPHSIRSVVLCLVDWAVLPLGVQAAVAEASHVVVAAHGGGNTWIALQRPHTVFIELWHSPYVPRNVFVTMAQEYNVRYYAHLRKDVPAPGNFMHQSVNVDVPQLLSLIDAAVGYLSFVADGW